MRFISVSKSMPLSLSTNDISVTLWILNKNKKERTAHINSTDKNYRHREQEILFMDLRRWGSEYDAFHLCIKINTTVLVYKLDVFTRYKRKIIGLYFYYFLIRFWNSSECGICIVFSLIIPHILENLCVNDNWSLNKNNKSHLIGFL
jgi:hypothetical protein